MPPKAKKAKKTKARKPQPLPRSVQALLKYLGGTDVKLGGGARGGQPATLAPTSINIAVSQQQQQQQAQQQQFVQQRVAPKGQIIAQSPLTSVISQQPIIFGLPQRRSDVEENEKKIETQKDELNKRLGVIETSQREILQIANEAYPNVNRRRNIGDPDIFDGEVVASRGKRPLVEEQQFAGVQVGEQEPTEWTEQGIYQAGQYLANVTNPEMTAIERAKRRAVKTVVGSAVSEKRKAGRPTKASIAASRPEYVKEFAAEVEQFKSKLGKSKQPTAADVSSLLEGIGPSTIAGFTPAQSSNPEPVRRTIMLKKKPVSTTGAPDMATQIAMLTGGGAALPPQSKGQNIAELLGAKKNV